MTICRLVKNSLPVKAQEQPRKAIPPTAFVRSSPKKNATTKLASITLGQDTSLQPKEGFTSADPVAIKLKHLINPQDLDRYSYVANNPRAFLDPDGREKIRIVVRSFIPDSAKWGYAGDQHRTGEKIGAK